MNIVRKESANGTSNTNTTTTAQDSKYYAFRVLMLQYIYTFVGFVSWVPMLHIVSSPKLEVNVYLHAGWLWNALMSATDLKTWELKQVFFSLKVRVAVA